MEEGSILKICVIGGLNVDLSGRTSGKLIPGDSNPGRVIQTLGGVGRNIAENLRWMGAEVSLITAYGDDWNGRWARSECESLGIDMSHAAEIPGASTGTYLCLLDERGDLHCAVSDMRICECITPDLLRPLLPVIRAADAVVIDTNLPEDTIRFAAENSEGLLAADPVSVSKANRLWDILPRLALIKPNMAEAAVLTGRKVKTREDAGYAASALLGLGVRRVMITMGRDGVRYADAQASGQEQSCARRIVSTNGCGDTFFSASLIALLHGMDIQDMARSGQAAAALCAESPAAVNPHITWDAVLSRMKKDM